MKQNNKNRGFGLLEVVVAAGILIIVIGASTALSRMAVRTTVISLDRIQAYDLSQQAMEEVRTIRDTNWLAHDNWNTGLELAAGNQKRGPLYLKYQSNQKKWSLTNGDEKITLNNIEYTRTIYIDKADNEINNSLSRVGIDNSTSNNVIKIIVNVSWQEYGQTWSNEAVTYLSNWTKEF